MNKNKWIFGAALLLFAACTQDDPMGDNGTILPEGVYPLEISSVTLDAEVSSQPWRADGPQTRVSENTDGNSSKWDYDEEITVHLGDSKTTYKFREDGSLECTGEQLYWTKRTDDVTAWYAFPAGEDGTVGLISQLKDGLAYVLQATPEDAKFDNPISLKFTHRLAKIRVKVEGEKANDVKKVEVRSYTLLNHNKGAEIKGSRVDWITMKPCTYNSETCWEASVVPDLAISEIRLNDTPASLTSSVTPKAGMVHEINITVDEKVTKVNLSTLDKPYEIKEGGKYIFTGSTTQRIVINADATVTLKGVTITSSDGAPIRISGNHTATLMLEDNNTLTAPRFYSAILPDAGSTVEIDGDGTLTAKGGEHGAGIGASNNSSTSLIDRMRNHAGYIKILGGIIEASGSFGSTGIGCSYYCNCQGIEISGGTVTARAGYGYTIPAIGHSQVFSGRCEYVTLTTCFIDAYSSYPDETDPVVANSVTPDVNDPAALKEAGVTLNEY